MTTKPRGPIIASSNEYASDVLCYRCKKIIPRQWPQWQYEELGLTDGTDQLDNNLSLEFHGGYGMFTDCIYNCPADKIILCHECAHDLCEFLGIDPSNWHTHRPESGQHPDHHKRADNDIE